MEVFEVQLFGFNGGTDRTDDKIKWVAAPSLSVASSEAYRTWGPYESITPTGMTEDHVGKSVDLTATIRVVIEPHAWDKYRHDDSRKVQFHEVFGVYDTEGRTRLSAGMIVTRGDHEKPLLCPIFGDIIQWKSVTVVCTKEQINDVLHWLAYTHGGCPSAEEVLPDGRIAIRSDYQCW